MSVIRPAAIALLAATLFAVVRPASVLALPSSAQGQAVVAIPEVHLLDLAGVRRLFDTLARTRSSMSDGEQTGAWTEFTLLAAAVVGDRSLEPLAFDELQRSATAGGPLVRATPGIATRDRRRTNSRASATRREKRPTW